MEADPAELGRRLQNAIDDAIHDNLPDGFLPIGWVMIAELAQPSGDKYLQLIQSREMTTWTARGMLESVNQDIANDWAAASWVNIQEETDEEEED